MSHSLFDNDFKCPQVSNPKAQTDWSLHVSDLGLEVSHQHSVVSVHLRPLERPGEGLQWAELGFPGSVR